MFVLLCNLGQRYSDIRRISPENFERNLFRIIQQKTGNKAVVDIDRYLNSLLKEIGEEFNDTVITEVKVGGVVNRSEKMLRSQICQDIRAVYFL